VAHICNPNYLELRVQEDSGLKQIIHEAYHEKKNYKRRAGGVA
jgi:hypothetical protein